MIRTTVAIATFCYAGAEWLRCRRPSAWRLARGLWTMGAVSLVAHSAAAFHFRHGWSHHVAWQSTAAQTAALTGLDWGGGLYINYAFLALWAADAVWWWRSPGSYARRPRVLTTTLAGCFLFMFVNGAVVFAHGAMRWFGAACVTIAAIGWCMAVTDRRRSKTPPAVG